MPDGVPSEDHGLVTLSTAPDLAAARLMQGLLQSAGIDCFIPDENLLASSNKERHPVWNERLANPCAVFTLILALVPSCGKSGPPAAVDAAPWVAESGAADSSPAPAADAANDSSVSSVGTGAAATTATGSGSGTGVVSTTATATGSATATNAASTTATGSTTGTAPSTGSGTGTGTASKTATGSTTGTAPSTGSGTGTGTASKTATGSATGTAPSTGSGTATGTASKTLTATGSATAIGTPSKTATATGTGGAGTATSTSTATSRCAAAGLVWKTANKTEFTSYPAPGSEECIKYSGCLYEGMFAGCGPTMPISWVQSHNIVSVFPDFATLKHHDLCLKSGSKTMVVLAIDTCADSDCSGCCTQNKGSASELIDIESFTAARFGVPDGPIQWADLGPTTGDDCPP